MRLGRLLRARPAGPSPEPHPFSEQARPAGPSPKPPPFSEKLYLRAWPRNLKLSVEEALYLASEAGFWTTREVQLQIVRSPPFSPRERPFLLEDFFQVADYKVDRPMEAEDEEDEGSEEEDAEGADDAPDVAHAAIHGTITKHFRPEQAAKFLHNGKEWLVEAEGHGTRRRATAHAIIRRGTGLFKVNGHADLFKVWPFIYNRFDVCQPFKLTGTACAYDVFVEVRGGGPGGQAGATRLAVARALLMANPSCHDDLQRGFCLLEDTRQKMSKMPGKKGSRASFSWNKR